MLLHVGNTIEILPFEKKIKLQTIITGTQVPKSMMKIKQYFKGLSPRPKEGTSWMDVRIAHDTKWNDFLK